MDDMLPSMADGTWNWWPILGTRTGPRGLPQQPPSFDAADLRAAVTELKAAVTRLSEVATVLTNSAVMLQRTAVARAVPPDELSPTERALVRAQERDRRLAVHRIARRQEQERRPVVGRLAKKRRR